jgi:hypothetical protein
MEISKYVIFCEGDRNSLDQLLLRQILQQYPVNNRPEIVPAGGKFTFTQFAQGYFLGKNQKQSEQKYLGKNKKQSEQKYLVFRDRDFDAIPESDPKLIQFSKRIYLTHRACIENYLLDAELIHSYWQEQYAQKQENPTSKWGHGDSPGVEEIATWIAESAGSLIDYQAVRWALGDLLRNTEARSQLKTTWTGGSGDIPDPLTLANCQTEAEELIKQFRQALDAVTLERFQESLTKYQQQFAQAEFWQQQQYLIWFHGKDIQKAMQKQRQHYISLDKFMKSVIPQLDIAQYPDFLELKDKIAQCFSEEKPCG